MWILIIVALVTIFSILISYLNRDYYILSLCKRIKTCDGTKLEDKVCTIPGRAVFGNNFDIVKTTPELVFEYCRRNTAYSKGKSYLLHFLFTAVYNVTNAEDAEEVLQSQALISKGVVYDLLHPFMGTGLLTSTDQMWQFRRKTLTPAFHFNILQTFIEVFKEESWKFVNVLNKRVGEVLPLGDVIPEFTLNNLCETALGVKLDDMEGNKEYRKSIHTLEGILVRRLCNPLMYYGTIFYIWGEYKEQREVLRVAHDFSSRIIQRKREEYQQNTQQRRQKEAAADPLCDEYGKKKRYAMLDTLLDAEAKGFIDHQGICDEVNTFMFEGYDTTSTCLIFALLNLALHPEIQENCYREIENLDDMANLTVFDIKKLEYLECVIKETLRLYPSVPFMGRQCQTETRINGLILPETAQINLHTFDIMRDPKHFPDPLVFDPNRFLTENIINRHPFAFVPFSAGPRNCIGQKFAMLEMKVLLVSILKDFVLLPGTQLEEIVFENGLVLRTQNQIHIKVAKRSEGVK